MSAASIRRFHIEERGFSDIGYHWVIDVDGELEKGRPMTEQGAHVSGENKGNIGICLVGEDRFTADQFRALRGLLNRLFRTYDIKARDLYCHYEFESAKQARKTCPNIPHDVLHRWYFGEDEQVMTQYLFSEDLQDLT